MYGQFYINSGNDSESIALIKSGSITSLSGCSTHTYKRNIPSIENEKGFAFHDQNINTLRARPRIFVELSAKI